MGTKWGEGKTRIKNPKNMHPKTQLMAAEYMRTGSVVKAAAKVDMTVAAAKKSLSSMRDYLREVMGEKGLTVESIVDQMRFLAWTGKNEMARGAMLKTLLDHVKDLGAGAQDDIAKMDMPELMKFLGEMVARYNQVQAEKLTSAITLEEQGDGSFAKEQDSQAVKAPGSYSGSEGSNPSPAPNPISQGT